MMHSMSSMRLSNFFLGLVLAFQVLTDYERYPEFIPDIEYSKVLLREMQHWHAMVGEPTRAARRQGASPRQA